MVDLALSSMSLAVFSKTQMNLPAAIAASSRYQRLLQVARQQIARLAVSALDERNVDAWLLAVSLMGRYEGAMYRPCDAQSANSLTSLTSWSHHDGTMAILKVWYDHMSPQTATFIIKQIRRELLQSCVLRNLPVPDWMLNGELFGEHDLELEYDRILVRIINLRYTSASIPQKHSLPVAQIEELSNEARELDQALQDWAAHIPSTCSHQQHILAKSDPWPRPHFYSSIVYSYPGPSFAAAWSNYFAARMLTNSTHLRILELVHVDPWVDLTYDPQRLECITNLKAMADNITASIPFCLGRLSLDKFPSPNNQTPIKLNPNEEIAPYLATLAVWPLTIASSLGGIDIQQQRWLRSELAGLGRITGDGILESAEMEQWILF